MSSLPEGFRAFFKDVLIAGPQLSVYLIEDLIINSQEFGRCIAFGQFYVHVSFDPSTDTCQAVASVGATFTGSTLVNPLFDLKPIYMEPFDVKVQELP